ncbi:hypothetical protein [Salegentibacter mishustinae]|uniref:hypothetical protein n=1 Tax=Salegentibacter mishustinae TaxID=270918 RepID=UPI00248F777B|nr:hypothetical protein [Salegentibacter mishustinae]
MKSLNSQVLPVRLTSLVILLLIFLTSCKEKDEDNIEKEVISDTKKESKLSKKEYEDRGKYLVEIIGCHDCHSPKKMGEQGPELISELAFSGYQSNKSLPELNKETLKNGWILMNPDLTAFIGPWGVSYSSNLTPHETGLGSWNFKQFKRAMVEGKYKGQADGRSLLPPMPWQNFKNIEEEDLRAMYMYLKSLEPVDNVVPSAKPLAKL